MRRIFALVLTLTLSLFTVAVSTDAFAGKGTNRPISSVELSLASRGIQIPATVVTPVGRKHDRFPLVVIHHGHGGGRNENGGLARVADALAKAGIMSIRFDFAGAGDSTEPFTKLTYTTMLADSNAALTWAVRNLPVDKNRIGGFGYSEGSAVVAMQAGHPFTPYKAVALLGPVAHPDRSLRGLLRCRPVPGVLRRGASERLRRRHDAVRPSPEHEPRVVPGDARRGPGRRHLLLQGSRPAHLG